VRIKLVRCVAARVPDAEWRIAKSLLSLCRRTFGKTKLVKDEVRDLDWQIDRALTMFAKARCMYLPIC
jgi:hypothetical protein